jgi:Domain of unknown function (DUF6504)
MNMVHAEPVHVQARDDGRPLRFVWRDRLYTIRAVLEHWVGGSERSQDPKGKPGQPDEFWRVEAAPGPGMKTGVYELRRQAATGAWTLRLGTG